MTSLFQVRTPVDYGKAIVKYNAGAWDDETKMLYLMGRKPDKYASKYEGNSAWQDFLRSKGLSTSSPLVEQSSAASIELVKRVISDDVIDLLTNNVLEKLKTNDDRKFNTIRVVVPFPTDPEATTNTFAPAIAAAVSQALSKKLGAIVPEIKIIADLDAEHTSPENAIMNIINNQRGSTSNPSPGEEVQTYMQRLVRQPIYSGPVDENTLYVPVDDFLVSQSTVAGLINYIQSKGGITTSSFTGVKLFNGTEVLAPQQETLDLLNLAIKDLTQDGIGGFSESSFKEALNKILGNAGLAIDFDDPKKTTLSNIELLFVAGYFSDGAKKEHQAAFAGALEAVGGSVAEAKGNSAFDIFNSPPGTLKSLQEVFEKTLEKRDLMIETGDRRYMQLEKEGMLINYQAMSL